MATLSSSVRLGTAGTSSLLKSATSLSKSLAAFQDAQAAQDYALSDKTDADFASYQSYLNGRISELQATGVVTDATKAISLENTLTAAMKSNISSNIQKENIAILSGTASKTDKYNLISNEYIRAVNNGDLSLAQSLESQAYTLSQSIQYDQQQAASSASTLAKAAASQNATSQKELVDSLKTQLTTFNTDYTHAGEKDLEKVSASFVKSITPTLNSLGIYLQKGTQPNYFDIVSGVNQAIFKAYTNEAQYYYAAGDTASYNTAISDANNAVAKISTAFGTMNAAQLQDAAANPNQYSLKESPDYVGQPAGGPAGRPNPQVGYHIDAQTGNVVPTVANSPWINIPQNLQNQIQALGLEVVGSKLEGGEGYTVRATNNTPGYIKKMLPGNGAAVALESPQGVQIEADAVSPGATGKAVYTFTKTGQVYESSNLGDRLIYGQPPNVTQAHTSFLGRVGSDILGAVKGAASPLSNLFLGHASAQDLINGAGLTEFQIAQANAKAAAALIAQAPPPLPKISIAPPPAPPVVQPPTNKPAPPVPTYPVAPKTVNPQSQSGVNIQGGSVNLQGSSGGGIQL